MWNMLPHTAGTDAVEATLEILASLFNKDQLVLLLVAAVVGLIGMVWWAARYVGAKVSSRLDKLEAGQSELNAKQDAFEKKVLAEYVSQDQLDRRIGGLKEMIAKLTETVNDLQTSFAVVMSHMGISTPKPLQSRIIAKQKIVAKPASTRKRK